MSETVQRAPDVAAGPPKGPGPGLGWLRQAGALLIKQREATVFIVALALFVYFSLTTSTFATSSNLANLLSGYAAQIIILSIGETLLLICGEIDLSVGFVFTFAPFVMHYLIDFYGVPGIPAIILSLVMGLVVGWVNGFFTVTMRVPSFITTFGTSFILYGLVLTTSHAEPASIPTSVTGIGQWIGGSQIGLPAWTQIIWAVVLVAIFHVVLTRTRWGLHTIAAGGNLLGAREAGIHVNRVKYGNFMITGVLGALVGIQVAFYNTTIDPSSGGYTPMFYAVAAAVLGGTAMLGGIGTILGGLLGAIVLAIILDGFSIIGISANPINIIFGAVILIAMVANVLLTRLRGEGGTV
ncbi:MAG: ABC transporter permease [Actinobacteria bacterium]|nr:ABC transporter permease [Actinomycetota bacterium]